MTSLQAAASTAAVALFPAAMLYAALSDLLTMKIRNRLVLLLAGAFFVLAPLAGWSASDIGKSVLTAGFVFAVTFFFFARGWIGGGDAKLAAASALWFAPQEALLYFTYASLFGGLLSLALLQFRRMPPPLALIRFPWVDALRDSKAGVPYGVAMGPAAVLVFPQTSWFAALGF